jgi:hypothetical protein
MIARRRKHALVSLVAAGLTATAVGAAVEAQATAPGSRPNGRLVFRRYLDPGKTTGALFTANPDGTRVRRVTRPRRLVIDQEPDWSADGRQLAFQRQVRCPAGGSRDGLDSYCTRFTSGGGTAAA